MKERNIKHLIYPPDTPLRKAVSHLYGEASTICLVCTKNRKLCGVVTLSDIKQALLKGVDPRSPLSSVMNKEFTAAPHGASLTVLRKLARKQSKYGTGIIEKIPLVDGAGRVVGLYTFPQKGSGSASRVLVTGGAGYVGSWVVRKLLKQGYDVVVLDKLLFGRESVADLLKHSRYTLIEGDIGNIGTLIKAVKGVDAVIHLAGIVGDPASSLDPLQTMEQNHFATKALIDICKYYGVSRFVFASSCSVYGAGGALLKEGSGLNPVSLYAQSKLLSEGELLKERGDEFHPVILRFGTLYGTSARMRFDLVANVMTACAVTKGEVVVDGGGQWRPLLHVEDAAGACVAALTAPLRSVSGEIFNVGETDENYTIAQIAEVVRQSVPKTRVTHADTVKDRRDYRVSFAKINRVMGWKASRTLAEGVREMVVAFKKKKFKDWKDARYSNYLTLKSAFVETAA